MNERLKVYEEKMKKTLASLDGELGTIRAAASSPNGTPKIHVPIKSTTITYWVLSPLRRIPPPSIIFSTLNGAITA